MFIYKEKILFHIYTQSVVVYQYNDANTFILTFMSCKSDIRTKKCDRKP